MPSVCGDRFEAGAMTVKKGGLNGLKYRDINYPRLNPSEGDLID
jgi:hypothetical protein